MKKVVILILLLIVVGAVLGRGQIEDFYQRFFGTLPKIEKAVEDKIQEVKKEVNAPPPLQAKDESPQPFLTTEGVIKFTNIQREKNGLPLIAENSLLDGSAQKKVQDMFAKQYFEHISPQGLDVSDLAEDAGYKFIEIGENLALGNFLNDEALVQAWMDSPGHRENILNSNYREIGVAVLKGTYQGKTTWMAVQHFGRPLSDCPQIDTTLKQQIENNKVLLDRMITELDAKKKELEQTNRKDSEYNQKVNEYNKLAEEYNKLAQETKQLLEDYNNQINNFNKCVLYSLAEHPA